MCHLSLVLITIHDGNGNWGIILEEYFQNGTFECVGYLLLFGKELFPSELISTREVPTLA